MGHSYQAWYYSNVQKKIPEQLKFYCGLGRGGAKESHCSTHLAGHSSGKPHGPAHRWKEFPNTSLVPNIYTNPSYPRLKDRIEFEAGGFSSFGIGRKGSCCIHWVNQPIQLLPCVAGSMTQSHCWDTKQKRSPRYFSGNGFNFQVKPLSNYTAGWIKGYQGNRRILFKLNFFQNGKWQYLRIVLVRLDCPPLVRKERQQVASHHYDTAESPTTFMPMTLAQHSTR